jgi:hypothetical protein
MARGHIKADFHRMDLSLVRRDSLVLHYSFGASCPAQLLKMLLFAPARR